MYFIKWSGYGSDDNTWEPIENLEGCRQLLQDFHMGIKRPKEKAKKAVSWRVDDESRDQSYSSPSTKSTASPLKKQRSENMARSTKFNKKERQTSRQIANDVYKNLGRNQFVDKWAKERSQLARQGSNQTGAGPFKIAKKPIYPGKASINEFTRVHF